MPTCGIIRREDSFGMKKNRNVQTRLGGRYRNRTCYLFDVNEALYQMS